MSSASTLIGQVLGSYRIVARLGAGGMGEVYRARDERLDREVAVKTLPAAFCGDEEKLRRFEQEGRALAALSDPNLLAIYDIGTQNGSPYIVSELLEGETLRTRLMSGPISFHRAVDFSMQIVRGLMAAHEKRMVHRDLKPENIFITHEGRVKILDFGLAKLGQVEQPPGSSDAATLLTTTGSVLGTAGYMSPEQVRGQTVDHRTDIFAFGAILYEMLTGKRAFHGATTADTISAILKEEPPDVWETNPNIPPTTAHIVRHCLEKRPEERFQSARDLLFDLGTLSSVSSAPSSISRRIAVEQPRDLRFLWAALGVLLLLAVAGGSYLLGKRIERPLPSYHQITFRRGSIWSGRFTSDAHTIVYGAAWAGNPSDIFSTRPESTESRSLSFQNTDLLGVSVRGEMAVLLNRRPVVRFVSQGTLARVPLAGGAPREIVNDVQQADWSPDGSQLAIVHHVGRVVRLEFPIGKTLFETTGWLSYPRFSPNGDRIAFMEHSNLGDDRGWVSIVDLTGRKRRISREFSSEQGLAWSARGDEVWFTASLSGEPFVLYSVTLGGKEHAVDRVPTNLMLHDIARDGTALLSSDKYSTPIIALPPGQNTEQDISSLDGIGVFDMSADGKTFLFQYYGEGSGSNYTSYLGKTDGSPPVRLGDGASIALSPDGKWALTIINEPRQTVLLPTGAGEIRHLERKGLEESGDGAWSPDSRHVVFTASAPGKPPRTYIQDIEGGAPVPLTPDGITGTRISPDDKYLLATGATGRQVLFALKVDTTLEVKGLQKDEVVIRWSQESPWLYAYDPPTSTLYKVDPFTGRRELLRKIVPSDPAGISSPPKVYLSADGKAYVYSFERYLSELYLVRNLGQK
jgi:eukaryotic-like serine/threonine-protein kinase